MGVLIGRKQRRLVFEKRVDVSDGHGGFTTTWATLATVWGSVLPLRGVEADRGMQLENPVTHKIKIRHRSDIDGIVRMRLKGTQKVYNIHVVMDKDDKVRFLELMALEGVKT